MDASLLSTKLLIPPERPGLVPRPRLMARLRGALNCSLILVSAPAGFGKTTVVSQWARQAKDVWGIAWVSLDEADNDPVRFWDYFIAALQTLQPEIGERALSSLHSSRALPSQMPPIGSVLTPLINDLATFPSDLVVVLDDYHLIESQQIHNGVTYLVEHFPPQVHLMISTRADPPLTLGRFRGRGGLLETGADSLRFTLEETARFFKTVRAPRLTAEDVAALHERTEGWAVGLRMAALSLQEQSDVPRFIAAFTGSQRYVMDYLMEEVLQKQPAQTRDFLLKTSVLQRLSGPVCDAVTESEDSPSILLDLEHRHLFIVPLDEDRQWYRYEHLFADLLRHLALKEYRQEGISELHRRASQWHEECHFSDEAIAHATAAEDWEGAARIIESVGQERTDRGEWATMRDWLRPLPDSVLRIHPRLCAWFCMAFAVTGPPEDVEARLHRVATMVQGDARNEGEIAASLAFFYQVRGDTVRTAESAQRALSLLSPDQVQARSRAGYVLGLSYWWRGLFTKAKPLLTEAQQTAERAGNLGIAATSLHLLSEIDRYGGRLRKAREQIRRAIELSGTTPAAAPSYQALGSLLGEWNQLEAAVYHMQKAIELGQLSSSQEFVARALILLAYLKLVQGDKAGSIKALRKSCSIAHKLDSPRTQADHAAFHIMIALMQEDVVTATEWGRRLALNIDSVPFYINLIPARLLIAQGERKKAAEELQESYEETARGGRQSYTIRLRLYQALAADDEESALEFLAGALVMAEPEGYVRTFVDEGKLLGPLLKKTIARGTTPEYATRLLDIIQEEQSRELAAAKGDAVLSRKELEVLRLVADGLTSQQICEKLTVSANTAKTHVRHILEKLDSRSRVQAIARARQMKLV